MPKITLDSGRSVELHQDDNGQALVIQDSIDRLNGTIETQQTVIDSQKDEIETLKQASSDSAIDARVAATVKTIDSARRLDDKSSFDGMSISDIQLTALKTFSPNRDFTDKSPAYIEASFDAALATMDMEREKMMDALMKSGMKKEELMDMGEKEMMDAYKKMMDMKKKSNDSHSCLADDIAGKKTERKLSAMDSYKQNLTQAHKAKG